MLVLLACLAHAPGLVDEWTVLTPPALCRSTPNPVEPTLLASGAHLDSAHADARFDDEPHPPALAYTSFLQMVEEDARLANTRLEVQREAGGALVRGDAAAVDRARAIQADLERAGAALDIDLTVELVPEKPAAGETALSFHRRVRSGDMTFFGRRDARAYVSGFEVEVAAHSGAAEPVLGRVSTGRGLHLLACRVEGGERVFVWGLLDVADLLEMNTFKPDTSDLGLVQQPRVAWAQAVFAGVVDAKGVMQVTITGARTPTPDWKLEVRATCKSDAALDAAAGKDGGFAVIDMALLSTELPQLVACDPGTLLRRGVRPRSIETGISALPPSAVATLVESARGPGNRTTRAGLYWGEHVLVVPRSDAAAVQAARAFVRSAEGARLARGQIDVDLDGAHASLPTCASAPARFATGVERPLLIEYRLEVAPEMWMPAPIVEPALDGVCFEITPQGRNASAAVWMSTSGPIIEVEREDARLGRLQLAARSLRSGAVRADDGVESRIELSGAADAVAIVRFAAH